MRKKEFDDVSELFDELVERELFTEEELKLLTNINGYSFETLNEAIFSRYGYMHYYQMMESEWNEYKNY